MTTLNRRKWLGAAALSLGGAAPAQAWELPWSKPPSARETLQRRALPDIAVQTHDGKSVHFYRDLVKDKMVVLNFMYVNCSDGTCPVATYSLKLVQQQLGDRVGRDIFFYSMTLDPERDTVEMLRNYADVHGVGAGWRFLRARRSDTDELRRGLGFYDRDPGLDAQKSNHLAMIRFGHEPTVAWGSVSALRDPRVIANAILATAPASARASAAVGAPAGNPRAGS